MKLSKIMLAVAAVATGTSAFAALSDTRIAYAAGASATKGNLKAALSALCVDNGGVLTEFSDTGNRSAYICATAAIASRGAAYTGVLNANFKNFGTGANATSFAELRLNVDAGSFSAVNGANGIFVDDFGADLLFVDPAQAATSQTKAQLLVSYPNATFVGGLMDVQPKTFPSSVTAGLTFPAAPPAVGIGQSFGVAVSIPLYTEMFNSQKSAGNATVDKPIPSTCLVTDTSKLECVPTISKGQMAAIMSNNDANKAYGNGANFLASTLAVGTELRYIRRVNTSGTQATAQNYFLGLPCSTAVLSVVDEPAGDEEVDTVSVAGFTPAVNNLKDALINSIRVVAAPGTGNVRQELSKSSVEGGGTNYAIGVMSGENNQTSGNSWRWLRVQGAPLSENSAPNNGQQNKQSVINGSYDFYYESIYIDNGGVGTDFWSKVSNKLNTLPAATSVGLIKKADLAANFSKGGNTCQFNSSN